MLIYFTSGTTSLPKMVMRDHGYAFAHHLTGRYWMDLSEKDIHWTLSDTGWAKTAWGMLYAPWQMGTTIVLHDATGGLIYDGYGQTETINLVANYPCLPVRPGSMGKPVPGFSVGIIDDDGNEMDDDQIGHIAVKLTTPHPPGLFNGYWQTPEATAKVFRNGWYYTGDTATRDAEGYFWFVGRSDDIISSASYRISPFEVESALLEHPAVAESAVVGIPDDLRGQLVKAFIVLGEGFSPSEKLRQEIQDFVKSHTAPYKYPREIAFRSALPKTISGKIRRVELREENK